MKLYISILGLFLFSMISSGYAMDKNKEGLVTLIKVLETKQNADATINHKIYDELKTTIQGKLVNKAQSKNLKQSEDILCIGIGTLFMFTTGITLRLKTYFKHGI